MTLSPSDLVIQAESHKTLEIATKKNFPALWPLLHAYLSAIAAICWEDFTLPVTLIASGPSGSGKTEPLSWIMKSGIDTFVRVDAFTPKSFVSHASNVTREKLAGIDLLPKLRDRCLCTKELAPIFSGREDELRVVFAQLTSILDGEGFVSSSGSHGTRGYEHPVNFSWLGATTPPSIRVYALMAALGTRMFFFSTDFNRPKASDYAEIISGKKPHAENKDLCRSEVEFFLTSFFKRFPPRSIPFDSIKIPEEISISMGLLCEALSYLRGAISVYEGEKSGEERHGAPIREHGWRAAQILTALAKGSALARGQVIVDEEDLKFVRHVALSSMPEYRRLTFESILENKGRATALDVKRSKGIAVKTALHYLRELAILGIGTFDESFEPFSFYLKEEFEPLWLSKSHTPAIQVTENPNKNDVAIDDLTIENIKDNSVTENEGVCTYTTGEVVDDF